MQILLQLKRYCMVLTGGAGVHIMGSGGKGARLMEVVMKSAQKDRGHLLVQNYRLVSEDLDTPNHRPSYHSSCHPQSVHLYEYMMPHHTHLDGEMRSEL